MRIRQPLRHIAAVGLLVTSLAACGGEKVAPPAPRVVEEGLVPEQLEGTPLAFFETSVAEARLAFTEAGPQSLASDGRLWEMRIADRLIGVLQLTALAHKVDLQEVSERDAIVRQLLPSSRDRFDVGDVTVWSTTSQGKTMYLWFGEGLFALFTLKPGSEDGIDPEQVLNKVLDHMVAAEAWSYEYFDEDVA